MPKPKRAASMISSGLQCLFLYSVLLTVLISLCNVILYNLKEEEENGGRGGGISKPTVWYFSFIHEFVQGLSTAL
jgi:hypothetical protein